MLDAGTLQSKEHFGKARVSQFCGGEPTLGIFVRALTGLLVEMRQNQILVEPHVVDGRAALLGDVDRWVVER